MRPARQLHAATLLLLLAAAPGLSPAVVHSAGMMPRRSSRFAAAASVLPSSPAKAAAPIRKRASVPAATAAGEPKATKTKKPKASPSKGESGANRSREEAAWARGVELCIGCDEAGRGPLAGPVVAAACALPASAPRLPGVCDSKMIGDEAAREALYEQLVATPGIVWSARVISAARIDEINILMASLEAMRLSITDVIKDSPGTTSALALVDGPFSPWKEGPKYVDFQLPQPPPSVTLDVHPVKGGDASVYSIAAASILAKVTRDRLMHAYDAIWPAYGLSQHKGYPVTKHVAAISKHGPCAIHRRTFAPLKHSDLAPPTAKELAQADGVVKKYEAECRAATRAKD